ncbi:HAD family phosphatase [Pseudoflavonifractor sp. MSJ-37]|uniref:HAD family hydrolase n=1 Tax=Pseudoflavonifractor sp. MSJ-37 TaxID=2841531 RepID=UPI001C0FE4F6|nr:HAD family phosphatase [Pseudoflavonifractor sp. MSJ-37]MBU5435129.1 HAD family phosphatase [Pseudoflavonifractor sp. MSJ-37]
MDKRFCIFDMDGTLVDSMSWWMGLSAEYLADQGIVPTPEELEPLRPMTMLEGAAYLLELYHLPGTPEAMVAGMEDMMDGHYRRDIPLKPGMAAYLAELADRGVQMCVATATAEPLARACLSRLGVDGRFTFILSCETLGVGKTRPDIYLEAARRFGAEPKDIAVFEDALYAAETAKKAGFYVVGVHEDAYGEDWPKLTALADEILFDGRNDV